MSNRSQFILLLKRIAFLLLLYTVCRVLFYAFNYTYFKGAGILPFIGGIRFDLSVIIITNIGFILLSLLPFDFFANKYYQRFLKILYLLINIPMLIFNFIDIEYFKFTQKRSTSDFIELFFLGDDIPKLLGQYAKDYWYLIILLIISIWIIAKYYPKVKNGKPVLGNWKLYLSKSASLIVFLGISLLLARGGAQLKPISLLTASNYSSTQHIPLVLNTPFSIFYSWTKTNLKKLNYLPDQEVGQYFNAVKSFRNQEAFKNKNVVIIILESFSKELIGPKENHASLTPFLDSLQSHSLVFRESYANGKKSIEALPSILASIPALMTEPYITSKYSANFIEGLPYLLEKKGYYTSFFHGGKNGTMGFDRFAEAAGFNKYYGMDDFSDSDMYDGNWGIYDEDFFNFFGEKISTQEEPFISCLFSLSSHHPYNIPDVYATTFTEKGEKIHRTIQYTDYALKKLFAQIKGESWFDNTLFVITADHTPDSEIPYYRNRLGNYSVPILFYSPKEKLDNPELPDKIIQHIDIMPTVLDLLNYDASFIAFGNSIYSDESWSINYLLPTYQFNTDGQFYLFDGTEVSNVYDIKEDSLLTNPRSFNPEIDGSQLIKLQAILQDYNRRMIENDLSIE